MVLAQVYRGRSGLQRDGPWGVVKHAMRRLAGAKQFGGAEARLGYTRGGV